MSDIALADSAPLPETGSRPAFDNSYARLPERLFARLPPTPVSAPRLLRLNAALAGSLGLDAAWLASPAGVAMLAGNHVPAGAEPIAQAYAGHQFGHFVPSLGDGRAILLGEVVTPAGERRDIQLKGSGPTPFSRRGDGRAAIGPVLREYIIGEAMAALGIPTTRALAAVATGDDVFREDVLPGAVLTRVAASHLRVGTFQYFAARRDTDALRVLADYAIARHYPAAAEAASPALALLENVALRQADLVAQWMLVGFIHGVMNTDNCAISGETIDYGPCAFMEAYNPETVFSSIDQQGRYAYGNQPGIAHWNLARLAECLLPLIDADEAAAVEKAQSALAAYAPRFGAGWRDGLLRKIGLTAARDGDDELLQDMLVRLSANQVDFTLFFRRLADAADGDMAARALFADPAAFDGWADAWRARLAQEPPGRAAAMRAINPLYIPRNHLVEEALAAAASRDDLAPFEALLAALSCPFEEQPGRERYAMPAQPDERVTATFCGT
ncbi:YdiU family protein [Roseomonas terrae]|uniref:Protein nucleotidyltransferase YdiU n=1 Tax=Neoroseomonas terrae TaxID=424799 RepID=A0ABS5EFC6_9PROT|nr:YdiU family protein [Neoroseomonas terrae]MBR0649719.1 YdiU family protein [Neoroseomonas terrae]